MNDHDNNEREATAAESAPQKKQQGEFTRRFLGDDSASPPLPNEQPPGGSAEGAIDAGVQATPPASTSVDHPGEFTEMFGAASVSSGLSTKSGSGSDLSRFGTEQGDSPKQYGASDVQPTEARAKPQAASGSDLETLPPFSDRSNETGSAAQLGSLPRPQDLADTAAPEEPIKRGLPATPPEGTQGKAAPPSGFTKLFAEAPPAPKRRSRATKTTDSQPPQPAQPRRGPSDYTRAVSERGKTAPGPAPSGNQLAAAAAPALESPQIPSPVLPSVPAPVAVPLPAAYPPQIQVQYVPATPPATPSLPQMPTPPAPQITPAAQSIPGSKWIAYLPVLIVINVLFMVAVLVVLVFALNK
jgi:hypothetical protein